MQNSRTKHPIFAPVVLVFLVTLFPLFALSPIFPDREYIRSGLSTRKDNLIAYLKNGIPFNEVSDENLRRYVENSQGRSTFYMGAIEILAKDYPSDAVPVLVDLVQKPLSKKVRDDVKGTRPEGLVDVACSALAQIGDARALPALKEHAESQTDKVDAILQNCAPNTDEVTRFGRICADIAALGDKDGVGLLIGRLDHVGNSEPDPIVNALRQTTGMIFGPGLGDAYKKRPAELEKWKKWWSQNHAQFVPDRQKILQYEEPQTVIKNPENTRDYVVAVQICEDERNGFKSPYHLWLEQEGKNHVKELKAIFTDPDENIRVRRVAMEWYAKLAGPEGYDLLKRYATEYDLYSPLQSERDSLPGYAYWMIGRYHKDKLDEVAKICLFSRYRVASFAADGLMRDPSNYEYVQQQYDKMSNLAKGSVLLHFASKSEPHGRKLFIQEVKNNDKRIAGYAAIGIRKFNLEKELPEDSHTALEKLEKDPEYQNWIYPNNKWLLTAR